jgi:hypothetical protein
MGNPNLAVQRSSGHGILNYLGSPVQTDQRSREKSPAPQFFYSMSAFFVRTTTFCDF